MSYTNINLLCYLFCTVGGHGMCINIEFEKSTKARENSNLSRNLAQFLFRCLSLWVIYLHADPNILRIRRVCPNTFPHAERKNFWHLRPHDWIIERKREKSSNSTYSRNIRIWKEKYPINNCNIYIFALAWKMPQRGISHEKARIHSFRKAKQRKDKPVTGSASVN